MLGLTKRLIRVNRKRAAANAALQTTPVPDIDAAIADIPMFPETLSGAQGPPGPQGPTGPQGPEGPRGATIVLAPSTQVLVHGDGYTKTFRFPNSFKSLGCIAQMRDNMGRVIPRGQQIFVTEEAFVVDYSEPPAANSRVLVVIGIECRTN